MTRLLSVALALVLLLVSAPGALADEGVDTTTVNVQFLGQTLMGTVVERYSCQGADGSNTVRIEDETWSFTGQFNGKPASASGKWEGVWDGSAYVGNITEITTWDMGTLNEVSLGGRVIYPAGTRVPKPKVPIAASMRPHGANAIWTTIGFRKLGDISVPMAVQGSGIEAASGKVPAPCQGARSFSVTNVAGLQLIQGLPRTGEAPSPMNPAALALIVLGSTALLSVRLIARKAR